MYRRMITHRALSILVLLVLVFGVVGIVPAGAQGGADATVRPDVLFMRHGPGSNYAITAELKRGTVLTLLGQNGPWVFARTTEGAEGWAATAYLDLAPGVNLDVLPFREGPADFGTPMQQGSSEAPAEQPAAPAAEQPAASFPEGSGFPGNTVGTVNMRTGAGTDYRVITTVQVNTPVLVKARNDAMDWVLINASGQDGWIYWEYVQLTSGFISQLPVSTATVTPGSAPAAPAGDDGAASGGAPVSVPAPVAGGPGLSGFGYGGHVDSFSRPDAMHHAGMTWVKRQIRFHQGDSGGVAAGAIQQAHGNGFKVLLGVVGEPGQLNNPGYFEDYARFVGEVAALGPDAIEVWNEMNIDREWPAGNIDPARYTQLLAQAYNAIKSANPNVAVISGAPAPTGAEGAFGRDRVWNDNNYLAGMAAAGAVNYMDCIGAHYNEGIVGPDQSAGDPRSEYYTRYFWPMVNTYFNAFGGARPVCFTELGYLSPEGYGPLPGHFAWGANTTVGQQAAWLARAVKLARGSGKVRLVIIWNVDFTQYEGDPMAGYAIIRPGGGCPACDALAGVR